LEDTFFAGTTDRLAIAAITNHHARKQNSGSCPEIERSGLACFVETRKGVSAGARAAAQ
jgi:hypothetical protein